MKKEFMAVFLMTLCFITTVTAKTYIDEDEAPLGLKWGMSLEDFKKNKKYRFKITDEFQNEDCPIKSVLLQSKSAEEGTYKLYFYEKFKKLNFYGLYAVLNEYESPDVGFINKRHSYLRVELNGKYAENKMIFGMGDEGFHTGNLQRFLYAQYDFDKYIKDENGNYYLSLSYFFYPKEYEGELEENIKEIRQLCGIALFD